jgi:hypothetical protein
MRCSSGEAPNRAMITEPPQKVAMWFCVFQMSLDL